MHITIEEIKELAKKRGGECLSDIYIKDKIKLLWKCKKNHIWETNYKTIERGSWCPYCTNRKVDKNYIFELKKIAKTKNGECLSEEYMGNKKKLKWKCKNDHIWEATPGSIKNGGWCRICFNLYHAGKHNKLKDGLKQANDIALKRGGKCLSLIYKTAKDKLSFECSNGHIWDACLSEIKKGRWCSQCLPFVREEICRIILKEMTGFNFYKKRFEWLKNNRGNSMELDGFCEELKFAFEHHGEYHFIKNKHFQRGKESLERRKEEKKKRRR